MPQFVNVLFGDMSVDRDLIWSQNKTYAGKD
jgi:lipopolysaccharide/colanic/teichoic acid biosynthesis glycosyltransferase